MGKAKSFKENKKLNCNRVLPAMKYFPLSNTSLVPSAIILGTGSMGSAISGEDAFAILDTYIDCGGNSLDTANCYACWIPGGEGASETTIGSWIKSRGSRGDVYVMTKGGHPQFDSMDVSRLSPEEITHDLYQSLERLQTDTVDFYWLHRDDPQLPVDEIISVLNEHLATRTIGGIGCSNWSPSRIKEANEYAKQNDLTPFQASQICWSLASRTSGGFSGLKFMDELTMDFHEESGLPVFAYSSQANGFFSGDYSEDGELPSRKSAKGVKNSYFNAKNFRRLKSAQSLAEKHGCTANQIALSYITSQSFSGFAIVGPRTSSQIAESCQGVIRLTEEELAFLDCGQS
ncbi:MAG: aldo/keto reductase [Planctomycetota bacterium]|nr:aldo/keto reductase [Planctomycetota bacterium]MDA1137417.1 aldo/keto reductase [Planctomycetota bacterium]